MACSLTQAWAGSKQTRASGKATTVAAREQECARDNRKHQTGKSYETLAGRETAACISENVL